MLLINNYNFYFFQGKLTEDSIVLNSVREFELFESSLLQNWLSSVCLNKIHIMIYKWFKELKKLLRNRSPFKFCLYQLVGWGGGGIYQILSNPCKRTHELEVSSNHEKFNLTIFLG